MKPFCRCLSVVALIVLFAPLSLTAAEWSVAVRFAEQVHPQPFSGRVYVFFSRGREEPRTGPNWFHPEQFLAKDVTDWKPGETLLLSSGDPQLLAFPRPLAEMDLTGSRTQAVARFNPQERDIGTGPGNGFSRVVTVTEPAPQNEPPELVIEWLVPEPQFEETRWTKLLRVRSKLLSDFHGRDVFLQAAVTLPASYFDEPEQR
ncbi:MAG: hypothetical protein ACREIV_14870, partial [Planctomycetaceae bacterium]